jgi:nicotinamide/nicotinate riboside kinase
VTLDGSSTAYLLCHHIGQSAWIDPEGYWDDICYPEYIRSHKNLFVGGDVEDGAPREDCVKGLLMIEPEAEEKKVDMMGIVKTCLEKVAIVQWEIARDTVTDIDCLPGP